MVVGRLGGAADTGCVTSNLHALTPVLVPVLALFGLVIGSFLNVVIARVPAGDSVVSPGSMCPKCQSPITARDNIPLVSWLLLRGRCRACAEPISVRYPAVEVLTAALFAGVGWWSLVHAPALVAVLLFLTAAGVALFMIDIDVQRLPDAIVLPSYPVVLVGLGAAGWLSGEWPVARVGLSALSWVAVFALPWFLTAGRGMGFGDVKLAPLLGAVLGAVGWGASLVGLLSGFLLGAVIGVFLLVAAGGGRRIPYGPYMLSGALLGLLVGQGVWGGYLSLMGLA